MSRIAGMTMVALVAAGCEYSPRLGECVIACASGNSCPQGLACSNGLCGRQACTASTPDAGGGPDASGGPAGGMLRWEAAANGLTDVANMIYALALDPKATDTVYAGADSGAWKSKDGGQTWVRANRGLPRESFFSLPTPVVSLAVDPANTGTIFAGVENGFTEGVSFPGQPGSGGLFISRNAGDDWSPAGNGPPSLARDSIRAVTAFAQSGRTYVFAGGDAGVYRSSDGGASWTEASTGLTAGKASVRGFAVYSAEVVYAATINGLFRMRYDGTTWTLVASFGGNFVACHPFNPMVLWADGNGGLQLTTDGGATWTATGGKTTALGIWAGMGLAHLYVGSDAGIAAQVGGTPVPVAGTPNSIVVNPERTQIAYAATSDGLFKTTDAGVGWKRIGTGLVGNPVMALAVSPTRPSLLHLGFYQAGYFRSEDGAATWSARREGFPPEGVFRFLAFAIDDSASLMWASAGVTLLKSADAGLSWTRSGVQNVTGFVLSLAASPSSTGTFYAGTAGNAFVTSSDTPWRAAGGGLPADGNSWVRSLAVDPQDAKTVWAATGPAGVYRTTDEGKSWGVTAGLPGARALSVAVDRAAPGTVYAAMDDHGVWKTTDGVNWQDSSRWLGTARVAVVAVARAQHLMVYAGTDQGVFRSLDGGANWAPESVGLNQAGRPQTVTHLVVDPSNPNRVTAGTWDGGVFRTVTGP